MLCTTTLSKSYRETELAAQPARRPDARLTATAGMLRTILGALREGLAAQRRYEHLRSKGVHHDPAIRQAFGISPSASASEERKRRRRAGCSA
jgi:hypothetical protein